MRLTIMVAAFAATSVLAQDVDTAKRFSDAARVFRECVSRKAKVYAKTKELPADIVAASFGACTRERIDFRNSVIAFRGEAVAKDVMAEVEPAMHRETMTAILEARYPDLK